MNKFKKSAIQNVISSIFVCSTLLFLGSCDSPAEANTKTTESSITASEKAPTNSEIQKKSSPIFEEANNGFTIDGKKINPLIIKRMVGFISESGPTTVSINVERAQDSNEFDCSDCTSETEVVIKNDRRKIEGKFSYDYLGKTKNGVHVVKTSSNEGGAFMQHSILFLRFKEGEFYNYETEKESQLLLVLEGIALAGQEDGRRFIESTVTITDNTVVLENQGEKEEFNF